MSTRSTTPRFVDHRVHADAIVEAALDAADPVEAVERCWPIGLPRSRYIKLLAVGKASIEMAHAACEIANWVDGRRPFAGGLVTAVPSRMTSDALRELAEFNIRVLPADHPLPTERNLAAANEVESFLRSCQQDETLLVLLSGGGSAHLSLPAQGITLEDLRSVSSALMRSGATIAELNAVRKHLEVLKGGRSARVSGAGRTHVLVLSDVIGDRLDVVSSGPFAPDITTFADALAVLYRYKIDAPANVRAILESGARGDAGSLDETPKPRDVAFERVKHTILASNANTVKVLGTTLERDGFSIGGVRMNVEGEASDVCEAWLRDCLADAARSRHSGAVAYVLGGETTVTVGAAQGLGGPSQEFALVGARVLTRYREAHANTPARFVLVTLSTDGIDGPTDAAGAIVTDEAWLAIKRFGIDPDRALKNHDSHHALDSVGALIRTGPTGTNVNHIAVLMVYSS